MKFWDSSALLPIIAAEPGRAWLGQLMTADLDVIVWWGTRIEIVSAIARREREQLLKEADVAGVLSGLGVLAAAWEEVLPTDEVRRTAERLLRTHPLRAADSLQLAAAIAAADGEPATLEFVCLDERLSSAARREGFQVIDRAAAGA
jgi:uncharacterized protein